GQLDAVKPGESRQLELQGQPVAVYRSPEGALHVVSGKCTHMGCALKWNGAETSWDCECHGSRFDCAGKVLEGPALAPLPRLDTGAPDGGAGEPDPNAGDE
ncbi:MAG TPA: FAD-dependent oxidoreductase, partial [Massilia sp.]|nr:FAD-dependent oxidoreductase [Massilia sp.]